MQDVLQFDPCAKNTVITMRISNYPTNNKPSVSHPSSESRAERHNKYMVLLRRLFGARAWTSGPCYATGPSVFCGSQLMIHLSHGCTHTHTHIHTHSFTHICSSICMHTHTQVCTQTGFSIFRKATHTHTHNHTLKYRSRLRNTLTHRSTHACTHTLKNTQTHTHPHSNTHA